MRNSEILLKELDGEKVLYDTKGGLVHFLNETASLVWALCDGTREARDIVTDMAGRFDASPDLLERDVRELLNSFREKNLIQ